MGGDLLVRPFEDVGLGDRLGRARHGGEEFDVLMLLFNNFI